MGPRGSIGAVAYVDASALVKLLIPEPESLALEEALENELSVTSSAVLAVELFCTAYRRGLPASGVERILARVPLLPLGDPILRAAQQRWSRPLRALDAIHLASARAVREDLRVLYTYDGEMEAAAKAAGLPVAAPR